MRRGRREVRRQRFDWKAAAGAAPAGRASTCPTASPGRSSCRRAPSTPAPAPIGLSNRVTRHGGQGQRDDAGPAAAGARRRPPATAAQRRRRPRRRRRRHPPMRRPPTPAPHRRAATPPPPTARSDAPADTAPVENRAWTAGTDIEQDPRRLVVHARRGHRRHGQRAGRLARRRGRQAAPPGRRHPQLGRHPDHRGPRHHRRRPGGHGRPTAARWWSGTCAPPRSSRRCRACGPATPATAA